VRIIVVGAGRVGLAVIELARGTDQPTLIERDPDRIERARRKFPGLNAIEGDATDDAILRVAGASSADAIIVATPDDPTNLMVSALAKRMGAKTVVARVNDDASASLFAEEGVTAVKNPSDLAAEHLYHAFEVPDVRSFMPVGDDGEVVTLVLSGRSPFANKKVREAHFPRDALLIAVNRMSHVMVPNGDLVLRAGDVLTMVARRHKLDEMVGSVLGTPGRFVAQRLRNILRR
jgi:trk system potassium uptake protein TrkA